MALDAILFVQIADISEAIAGVVQDDIEDDVQAGLMSSINQITKFIVGPFGVIGKPRLGAKKIVDAVAVVSALLRLEILKHRTEPDGAGAQTFYIGELSRDARELTSLEF